MTERTYTPQQAAQELLDIVRDLSNRAYVFRAIDRKVEQRASDELTRIGLELIKLGYAVSVSYSARIGELRADQICFFQSNNPVLSTMFRARSILHSIPQHDTLPFSAAVIVSKNLLEAAKILSIFSSSHLFLPNCRLPPELLHLIYEHVAFSPLTGVESTNDDSVVRQRTLFALSSTSTVWRQLLLERPVTYITTIEQVRRFGSLCRSWHDSDSPLWRSPWEELHIDLVEEDMVNVRADPDVWKALLNQLNVTRPADLEGEEHEGQVGKLVITLRTKGRSSPEQWGHAVREVTERWNEFAIQIPFMDIEGYTMFMALFEDWGVLGERSAEYYIGSQYPAYLAKEFTQDILDKYVLWSLEDSEEEEDPEAEDVCRPIIDFRQYIVFAVPYLVFTAPIFLLETTPKLYRPPDHFTCRLRHLEITFEVDPSDSNRANREIDSFFSAISPRIERLAFRLRLARPYPQDHFATESSLNTQLISSLASCKRLRHLEIGGFGFEFDFFSQLCNTSLLLTTLVLLPTYYIRICHDILSLLKWPGPVIKSLKTLRCGNPVYAQHRDFPEGLDDLKEYCRKEDIELELYESYPEAVLLGNILDDRGF
jgi:hypothetical protein